MANPNENRINITIAPADVTAIDAGFTGIGTALNSYTQALTEDEREKLFSVAEENEIFADDALEQGQLLSAQLPPMVATIVTNLATDTTLHEQLDSIEDTQLKPLMMRVSDTKRLVAHERYVAALAIYAMIEAGAKMAMPGFQAAYDILKVRFAGQGRQPEPQP
jgi:acetyl/propionyl-CoA carboxylase alpha subunit